MISTVVLSEEITYTGRELYHGWIAEQTKVFGDCIISFIGPCDVQVGEFMKDLQDVLEDAPIRSSKMLHFVAEIFRVTPLEITLLQRLFLAALEKLLREQGAEITREGDDLFVKKPENAPFGWGKLSVSIATATVVSGLIHIGLNLALDDIPEGVQAASLAECGVTDIDKFQHNALKAMVGVWESAQRAVAKVRY